MLSSKCVQISTSIARRGYATQAVAAKAATKPPPVMGGKIPIAPKPKKVEPEPLYGDDFISDPTPVTLNSTPIPPITRPIQPYANKNKTPSPPSSPSASKVLASVPSSNPSPTSSVIPPVPSTPATNASAAPTPTALPPSPTPSSNAQANKKPPNKPVGSTQKAPAKKGNAPSLAQIPHKPAQPQSANAQKAALSRELGGRTPAQLLNQITQLQHQNASLQSQLVYHSAVEAIYGESGFNQLRNVISEFTEEEANILKASGFESENVIHLLEARQRDLCLQFTQTMGTDLAKHLTAYVKKLKDQHRQSTSASTATQQTLRNAGVPDAVITSTLVGLQPHLEELQARITRWEKLKADVDLLIATHSNH
eukprot:Phypoly_transcript_11129.p1 GENE.Phypoly_transcript_11129~~Phypoly_transcript_11129.p1  ORF type:complete len:367 (+),score=111.79 Phypoly_transcript_11129:126-1226(+)